jgi:predicted transport protein
MCNLISVLQDLQPKLDRFRKEPLKETPTRTIFIDPILAALGWDVRDPDQVQLEYPTVDGKSVDYALKINKKAVLLVEAKPLTDPLTDVKCITQTTGYAANDGIVWCILTNGLKWRVYRSVEQCPAPEKLMFEVSYDALDLEGTSFEQIADKFQRFSVEQMAKGTLDTLGEQAFTDGKTRKALQKLIAEPPSAWVKLVRNATGDQTLRPQAIKESLRRILAPLLGLVIPKPTVPFQRPSSSRMLAGQKAAVTRKARKGMPYSEDWHTKEKPREVLELFQMVDQFCLGLRPGALEKRYMAKYIAYRDGKRIFCCVHLQQGGMRVWLKLDPQRLPMLPPFARDVSNIGHWGVGDVELAITNPQQLTDAQPLIAQSFAEA